MVEPPFLSEKDWRNLLRDIHSGGQVIPVIGPDLVTVQDPGTGSVIPLYTWLAPRLATALGLEAAETLTSLNQVACAHLLRGRKRKEIYDELRELIDKLHCPLPAGLLDLARITDFGFYVSSTFDPLLARALQEVRPGFLADDPQRVLHYHPNEPVDLPSDPRQPLVYHIMGDYNTFPDFAVWEEDYMEFICGLIEASDTLENLFRLLKNRYLLILGAPFTDWVVRFFLRAARQKRLTDRGNLPGEFLADHKENLGEPLIFFFDKVVGATRIIDGDPVAFAHELAARWQERYGCVGDDQTFLARQPDQMPRDSVFISYSRDDLAAVCRLAKALTAGGLPIWLDKQRLQGGENYEQALRHAVMECSFFISLISRSTEADPKRYVHKERDWAASRHVDGFVFYLPVVIDDSPDPRLEPACFHKIQYERLPAGEVIPAFHARIRKLVDEYRASGRPRG